MSIAEKLTTVAENVPKVYESGQKAEYDRFWDIYQQSGIRGSYDNAFAGSGWTTENFKPKYDINATNAYMLFRANTMKIDLVEYLENLGITLSVSNANGIQYAFNNSRFTHIGVVDARKTTTNVSLDATFSNNPNLVTIDKIILNPEVKTAQFSNTFTQCVALENIAFEGEIKTNGLNLQWSTKLSKESITNIINVLSSTTTGLTVTLSKTAVNNAFGINVDDETTYPEGTEYYNLRHSKDNWTISYV